MAQLWKTVQLDIVFQQPDNVIDVDRCGEHPVITHIFKARFHGFKVLLADHQIAADIQKDIADPGLVAAIAQALTINLTMAID